MEITAAGCMLIALTYMFVGVALCMLVSVCAEVCRCSLGSCPCLVNCQHVVLFVIHALATPTPVMCAVADLTGTIPTPSIADGLGHIGIPILDEC